MQAFINRTAFVAFGATATLAYVGWQMSDEGALFMASLALGFGFACLWIAETLRD